MTGKRQAWLLERYTSAMRSVRARLLRRTAPASQAGLWYLGEEVDEGKRLSRKFDHLVCFLPGERSHGSSAAARRLFEVPACWRASPPRLTCSSACFCSSSLHLPPQACWPWVTCTA